MKTFLNTIRNSLFLSMVFSSIVFTLGNLLTWILGIVDELSTIELIFNPVIGALIGAFGYYLKEKKKQKI